MLKKNSGVGTVLVTSHLNPEPFLRRVRLALVSCAINLVLGYTMRGFPLNWALVNLSSEWATLFGRCSGPNNHAKGNKYHWIKRKNCRPIWDYSWAGPSDGCQYWTDQAEWVREPIFVIRMLKGKVVGKTTRIRTIATRFAKRGSTLVLIPLSWCHEQRHPKQLSTRCKGTGLHVHARITNLIFGHMMWRHPSGYHAWRARWYLESKPGSSYKE